MNDWIAELKALCDSGESSVVVSVAGVRGSAPREVGAKMIVTAKQTIGSIGGGQLEYRCAKIAFDMLQSECAEPTTLRRFPLGSSMGQCCGGVVDILLEPSAAIDASLLRELFRLHDERLPFVVATSESGKRLVSESSATGAGLDTAEVISAARGMLIRGQTCSRSIQHVNSRVLLEPVIDSNFDVAVFGAGHVGAALVQLLAGLNCKVRWIDSRRNLFPAQTPVNVTAIESARPGREVAALPGGAYCVVLTHSHPLDYDICARILQRGDAAYCGLIGSISKRRRFEKLMLQQGMSRTVLDDLTCPIGVGGIAGKQPEEIAIAVAAELLRLRDAGTQRVADDDRMHLVTAGRDA